jgi:NAD(P)H dehydrogenase (quinone)
MAPTLLVTGAAGQLGRRVVEILLERGGFPIIATTRDPAKLADLAARGVIVRAADFERPETLAAAFAGADRMLLISTDAVVVPGQRLAQHRAAVAAAVEAGVKHILYTSLVAPKPSRESGVEDDHFWTEQAIAASPVSWTFLRHALYGETLFWTLPQALAAGRLATATADQPRHWVSREDCAQADAAALASGDTSCRIYDITGPQALRASEVAALVATISGRPLEHAAITPAELAASLAAAGLPPALAGSLVGFDVATALGYHASVTPAVAELSGREPIPLREVLAANREALGVLAA